MDKAIIKRIYTSALHICAAVGVIENQHFEQVLGCLTRKVAEGVPDMAAYDMARTRARELKALETANEAINQMIRASQNGGHPIGGHA